MFLKKVSESVSGEGEDEGEGVTGVGASVVEPSPGTTAFSSEPLIEALASTLVPFFESIDIVTSLSIAKQEIAVMPRKSKREGGQVRIIFFVCFF